jgi:hypothetical protein
MIKSVHLNYDFTSILAADHRSHSGTCIGHLSQEMIELYKPYGGLPASYCVANTTIHQLWWDATQLDFAEIGKQLNMEVLTVSSILQDPGCVIPWHRDTFFLLRKNYPARKGHFVRANIHLEPWKIGHIIQYEDRVITHWQAGDGIMWDGDIPHLGANAGMEPKITMQISGLCNE